MQLPEIAASVRRSYESDLGQIGTFLPSRVPVDELPPPLQRFLSACTELPHRYPRANGGVRAWLDQDFRRDSSEVRRAMHRLDGAESDALMTALSALGHTYRWDSVPPTADRFLERRIPLPAGIAGPWGALARTRGEPRVGSAWSLHLTNWKMPGRPGGAAYRPDELSPGSLRIARTWLEPPVDADLEAFSLSFVLMEALGAEVLRALVETIEAAAARRIDETVDGLRRLQSAVAAVTMAFSRNVRRRTVDPAIWLELIQPTFAWAAHGEHPTRIEGGPSGMQLGTIQALDAALLGVKGRSAVAGLAVTARRQMPKAHRRFLSILDMSGPLLRRFVRDTGSPELTDGFNSCVAALGSFRLTHRGRGALYLRSRPPAETGRASTGLMIGVDDDPVDTFERAMDERIAESRAAIL